MKLFLTRLRAFWRVLWGYCPACNSDAPRIDTCACCCGYRRPWPPTWGLRMEWLARMERNREAAEWHAKLERNRKRLDRAKETMMSEPTYDEKKDQVVQSVIGMFKMLTEGMTSTEQVGCRDAVIYWLGKAVGEGRAIPDNPLDKELREVREVLAKAMERLDDGSAWADDSDEFRHMCDVSGYVRR